MSFGRCFRLNWLETYGKSGAMLCRTYLKSLGAPNWVIPVGKEPLALYLQMSNMKIGIQEVFYVECVVCVTLIMRVKC